MDATQRGMIIQRQTGKDLEWCVMSNNPIEFWKNDFKSYFWRKYRMIGLHTGKSIIEVDNPYLDPINIFRSWLTFIF